MTVLVADDVQPNPLVTVAVYTNTVDVETVVGCTYTVVVVAPVYGIVNAASMNRFVAGDHVADVNEVIVRLPPLHIAVTDGVTTGVAGKGLTVTTVVAVVVHVPLVELKTYVPALAAVTPVSTGLSKVELKPAGPLQDQLVPEVVAVSVTVPPGHTPALALGVAVTEQVDHLRIVPSLGGVPWAA